MEFQDVLKKLFSNVIQDKTKQFLGFGEQSTNAINQIDINTQSVIDLTEPGDIIITRTPGPLYQIMRGLMNIKYDHVTVVLDQESVFHIAPIRIRTISIQTVLHSSMRPTILRPNLSKEERQNFLDNLAIFQNQYYNLFEGFKFFNKNMINQISQYTLSSESNQETFTLKNKICTSLVFSCLAQSSTQFTNVINQYYEMLDVSKIGNFSFEDFMFLTQIDTIFTKIYQSSKSPIKQERTIDILSLAGMNVYNSAKQFVKDGVKKVIKRFQEEDFFLSRLAEQLKNNMEILALVEGFVAMIVSQKLFKQQTYIQIHQSQTNNAKLMFLTYKLVDLYFNQKSKFKLVFTFFRILTNLYGFQLVAKYFSKLVQTTIKPQL